MQMDFHYYATYCAAFLAGYSHAESLVIAYSSQLVDVCSAKFLKSMGAPVSAATTQVAEEIMDMNPNTQGRQELSRIWSAFHFLPYDLHADSPRGTKAYKNRYRLLCNSNGDLVCSSVNLAKNNNLQSIGIAMHVLSDTWAHKFFAGLPSLVMNNVEGDIIELVTVNGEVSERNITFKHDPTMAENVYTSEYINSLYTFDEYSIMNLGHDRIGRLPDYSFAKYRYIPSWGEYHRVEKDNPQDYLKAFCQMIYAMKCLREDTSEFKLDTYDYEAIDDYRDSIKEILNLRTVDTCAQWKTFGEQLSEQSIPDFNINQYVEDYSLNKENSFLAKFIDAALLQKNMVTYAVWQSGNPLLGNAKQAKEVPNNE